MDDDKEKMVEKYGDWARFMTESEAKSMLRDYGKVMEIMKGVLEVAFGEGHNYSIDDGQANDGCGLNISGDLDGVASYMATLTSDSTNIMFTFYYDLPKLDCDASEIEDEIQRLEDDDIFDHDMDLHSLDVEDDGDGGFFCNWEFHCEPMFEGVPTMDELIEFDNRVKEIINSHKK